MTENTYQKENGFTLLEVLFALAIFFHWIAGGQCHDHHDDQKVIT